MGKKRGGKKKGSGAKPKDPKVLPFLQDMFSNIDKDIVGIILEQNEHDEEKTIQQLEELSMNDGTQESGYASDELEELGDLDKLIDDGDQPISSSPPPYLYSSSSSSNTTATTTVAASTPKKTSPIPTTTTAATTAATPKKTSPPPYTSSNTSSSSSNTTYTPTTSTATPKRTSPPPFMSTEDSFSYTSPFSSSSTSSFSSFNTTSSKPTPTTPPSNKRHSPQKNAFGPTSSFISTSPPHTSSSSYSFDYPKTTSTSTSTASTAPSSKQFTNRSDSATQFLTAMFPELDSTMLDLVLEENNNDVGKTVESLLSIVFMSHNRDEVEEEEEDAVDGDGDGDDDDDDDDDEEEALIISRRKVVEGEDSEQYEGEVDMDDFKFDLPHVNKDANDSTPAVKSDFIMKLNLLAELFPSTPRTLLALELDELDCDLEKTIASCCRADPDYLKRLSGENVSSEPQEREVRPKIPAAVTPLKPNWVGAGGSPSHSKLIKPKYEYVKPKKQEPIESTTTTTTTTTTTFAPQPARPAAPKARPMDLAAKLKLKQLREKFGFVEPEILEAVFMQCDHSLQNTLKNLYDIYPHLRMETAAGPPKLTGKRAQPEANTKEAEEEAKEKEREKKEKEKEKKKKKRKTPEPKPKEEEFVTVTYRKKREETTSNKKHMTSEDIENAYHDYREEAIKAQEHRDYFAMCAAEAYQRGDGFAASKYAACVREWNGKVKIAHERACHQIFSDCNARFDTFASIDLHGLHVAEALVVVQTLLEIHDDMGETDKPRTLRIITGKGNHSIGGIARIRPAVKQLLRSRGYVHSMEAGAIVVALSKH